MDEFFCSKTKEASIGVEHGKPIFNIVHCLVVLTGNKHLLPSHNRICQEIQYELFFTAARWPNNYRYATVQRTANSFALTVIHWNNFYQLFRQYRIDSIINLGILKKCCQ